MTKKFKKLTPVGENLNWKRPRKKWLTKKRLEGLIELDKKMEKVQRNLRLETFIPSEEKFIKTLPVR